MGCLSFRDDREEFQKTFNYIKIKENFSKNSDVLIFLISEYALKNGLNKFNVMPIERFRKIALRMTRKEIREDFYECHNLPSIKESLLKLIFKKADIETIYKMYQKTLNVSKFDINNQKGWEKYKKLKLIHFKKLCKFCYYLCDERHLPKKYIIENIGFDILIKNKFLDINLNTKEVNKIERIKEESTT